MSFSDVVGVPGVVARDVDGTWSVSAFCVGHSDYSAAVYMKDVVLMEVSPKSLIERPSVIMMHLRLNDCVSS